jgi:hypothetical protein
MYFANGDLGYSFPGVEQSSVSCSQRTDLSQRDSRSEFCPSHWYFTYKTNVRNVSSRESFYI